MQKTFFTYFGIKPSIAVSQICNGLENLNLMYGQCETALESKFFYPPEQLLFYKKVLREDKQKLVELQNILPGISANGRNADPGKCHE